jgi:hypothetical protein
MGTKGLYGYLKKDGEYTAQYNSHDSYPDGLGIQFYSSCISEDYFKVEEESISFIYDSLFCEWAYFYDKQNRIFEIWIGFQKAPDPKNPFGKSENDNGYYPCKRILRASIDSIDTNLFENINNSEEFIKRCKMYNRNSKIDNIIK